MLGHLIIGHTDIIFSQTDVPSGSFGMYLIYQGFSRACLLIKILWSTVGLSVKVGSKT